MIKPEYYKNENGIDLFTAFQQGILSKTEYIGFLKGNIMKYTQRCNQKHQNIDKQIEDLNKAETYINELKKVLEDKQ